MELAIPTSIAVILLGSKLVMFSFYQKQLQIPSSCLPLLTLLTSTPQNRQTHSNNSLATAGKLFECVWQFCGVGA